MNDQVVEALQSLTQRSNSYPFFIRRVVDVEKLFNDGKPQQGFRPEVAEWMQLNGFKFFEDLFIRIGFEDTEGVAFFFRDHDIASHFKLRWL